MRLKSIKTLLLIIIGLFLCVFLTGCLTSSSDELQISKIAKNIEESIKEKDADLFMESISFDYSDTKGGTFDNHINHLPEGIFSNIEDNEELVDFFSIFKIEQEVSIPENDIIVTDIYATGKMEIKISLKGCILWVICTDLYNETLEYDADFIKEDDEWKIISLTEK